MNETQAQQDCEYCHKPYRYIYHNHRSVQRLKFLETEQEYCLITQQEQNVLFSLINNCPMCGRKFEEEND